MWLQRLTRPVLNLKLALNDFLLIDVENYLTLQGTGEVTLTGPIERPVLGGIARASDTGWLTNVEVATRSRETGNLANAILASRTAEYRAG